MSHRITTTPHQTIAGQAVACQGPEGSFADLVRRTLFPDATAQLCKTFEGVLMAVSDGTADYGLVPIENSIAGRVADIHTLLQETQLFIVREHFQPIRHALMAAPGATLDSITTVHSHVQALAQCRKTLRARSYDTRAAVNTAAAAAMVAEQRDPTQAALASTLAAERYGLTVLLEDAQDIHHNVTRFVVMAREAQTPPQGTAVMTSMVFRLRSIPAALYKAIGGFSTNGVNMTKLESYVDDFSTAEFLLDIEGHPDDTAVKLALEELAFFTQSHKILGTYPAHLYRQEVRK